jgi:hypothetical protein
MEGRDSNPDCSGHVSRKICILGRLWCCLIMHNEAHGPMHYALCIMQPLTQGTTMVPPQTLCIMTIMHRELMHYEVFNCNRKACLNVGRNRSWASRISAYSQQPPSVTSPLSVTVIFLFRFSSFFGSVFCLKIRVHMVQRLRFFWTSVVRFQIVWDPSDGWGKLGFDRFS